MNLTLVDFETWYTTTYTTPYACNSAEVELLLELYLAEISTIIPIERKNVTKIYTFDSCGEFYLACPVWENYTVQIGSKKDIANLTSLTENIDYLGQYSYADSNKIIGLDFSCLRCNCHCEIVKITGNYGYKIPDILVKMIFKLIVELSQSGFDNCCGEDSKILTSVKTGSVSKSYQVVDIDDLKLKSQLKKGYGIGQYEPVKNYLRRYKHELIII
jgi:hypothetical protein